MDVDEVEGAHVAPERAGKRGREGEAPRRDGREPADVDPLGARWKLIRPNGPTR
jgi:hypothetical protein